MNRIFTGALILVFALFTMACGEGEAKTGSGAKVSPKVIGHGKALYDSTCASCHGPTGRGDGPMSAGLNPKPRDLGDKSYVGTLSDEEIARTIKMGGSMKGMPQMPSHPQFNDDDLEALVAYVRSIGN
jgi:mono/diheme cytochrome c family protein